MPKLYYAGHIFELAPISPGETLADRIDQGLIQGRNMVASTKVPTNMILAATRLANGNELIFGFSGSLPFAVESDSAEDGS